VSTYALSLLQRRRSDSPTQRNAFDPTRFSPARCAANDGKVASCSCFFFSSLFFLLLKSLPSYESRSDRLSSLNDPSNATFSFVDEDHMLANSVSFCLNQESVCVFIFFCNE
ncbi:hypothetical protein LINPERHAP2_LOCUS8190, partial [Linum perenne]